MRPDVQCHGCGKTVPNSRAGQSRKWCNQRCKKQYLRRTDPEFRALRAAEASKRHQAKMAAQGGPRPKTIRVCTTCGRDFLGWRTVYCSESCRTKPHTVRQRATRRGRGISVKVEVGDIYHRDGGRCQLCRKPVNRQYRYPHRLSASLDHIIPVSLGGLHVPSNVQLAHLFCNLSKHNRPAGEQLRLVG